MVDFKQSELYSFTNGINPYAYRHQLFVNRNASLAINTNWCLMLKLFMTRLLITQYTLTQH